MASAGAKAQYSKLKRESLKNPVEWTFEDVTEKYKPEVKAMADADLESGKLPQWQYDKMFGINGEEV